MKPMRYPVGVTHPFFPFKDAERGKFREADPLLILPACIPSDGSTAAKGQQTLFDIRHPL